ADPGDDMMAIQALVREWLVFAEEQTTSCLSEVYHAGAARLRHTGRNRLPVGSICRLEKRWFLKPAEPLPQPPRRGAALVLVNNDTWPIARALFREGDFSKIVLVADSSIAPHHVQNS